MPFFIDTGSLSRPKDSGSEQWEPIRGHLLDVSALQSRGSGARKADAGSQPIQRLQLPASPANAASKAGKLADLHLLRYLYTVSNSCMAAKQHVESYQRQNYLQRCQATHGREYCTAGLKAKQEEDMTKAELLAEGLQNAGEAERPRVARGAARKWRRRHAARQVSLQQPGSLPSFLSGTLPHALQTTSARSTLQAFQRTCLTHHRLCCLKTFVPTPTPQTACILA